MEHDLPSDSDESDVDYCPSGGEAASEEDDSGEEEGKEDHEDGDENCCGEGDRKEKTKQKRKRRQKPTSKRKILKQTLEKEVESEEEEEPEAKKLRPEEEKKKADSLWADFLKDAGGPPPRKTESKCDVSSTTTNPLEIKNGTTEKPNKLVEEKENKVTVQQIFEFAGEKVTIENEVPSESAKEPVQGSPAGMRGTGRGRGRGRPVGSSALTSFIGQLGKKGKLNMLEKSKLDWDQFKKKEGIDEDLQKHNKGRDGYLEKQDFLQRTDVRQFEIEKGLRAKRSGR